MVCIFYGRVCGEETILYGSHGSERTLAGEWREDRKGISSSINWSIFVRDQSVSSCRFCGCLRRRRPVLLLSVGDDHPLSVLHITAYCWRWLGLDWRPEKTVQVPIFVQLVIAIHKGLFDILENALIVHGMGCVGQCERLLNANAMPLG